MLWIKRGNQGVVFALLFFFFCACMGCTSRPSFSQINDMEEQYLEVFFRHLFATTSVGYVLYGEKPLSFCTVKSIESTIPGTEEHRDAIIFTQGLQAWEKLASTGKNYLLFSQVAGEDTHSREIIFVNKKAFQKAIRKNRSLFQLKLGVHIDAENLLEAILRKGFLSFLHNHESLQGILLWCGVENALTYERGEALYKEVLNTCRPNPPFAASRKLETLEEIQEQMLCCAEASSDKKQLLQELEDFSFYSPEEGEKAAPNILFSLHTKSEETKKLIEKYKEAEKKIQALTKEKKFLSKVLQRLEE